ncbi:MAG: fibronectin type III domain-containing protein [Acidimicrobiales bacterium]
MTVAVVALVLSTATVVGIGARPAAATPVVGSATTVAENIYDPFGIVSGPDGNLWFTSGGDSVGRMTTAGVVTVFHDASIHGPGAITAGADGNLWFVSSGPPASIVRITTAGVVTAFTGAGIDAPSGITAGADGALWFTNGGSSPSIGRITTTGSVSTFTDPKIVGPGAITSGADGNLWFTSSNAGSGAIGRITTAGVVTSFTAASLHNPNAITSGPDGNVWFTDIGSGSIGSITPAGSISFVTVTSRPYHGLTAGPSGEVWVVGDGATVEINTGVGIASERMDPHLRPSAITAGSDGNLWFTNSAYAPTPYRNTIGRLTTDGVTTPVVGNGINDIASMVQGPDGNLWFTNGDGSSVGRLTPGGVVSRFTDASIDGPRGITVGPDGSLWFANLLGSSIGRITVGGAVTSFGIAGGHPPDSITSGPDGNLWFTSSSTSSIAKMTPAGQVTLFTGPAIDHPASIVSGPDGNLWFTSRSTRSVGRITPAGEATAFTSPSVRGPVSIAAGPDGNLWFTDPSTGILGDPTTSAIGRITPAGVITSFTNPAISSPSGISTGPDGNVWFTNTASIGRITPAGFVTAFTGSAIAAPGSITGGPSGTLWFSGRGNAVGTIVAVAVPGAPTPVAKPSVRAGDARVEVRWGAPGDGGSPITGYTVTALHAGTPTGQTCTAVPPATTCSVLGLTNGTAYTFTVTATNALGTSPASAASDPATPSNGDLFHPLGAPTRILDSRPPPEQVGPYSTPWAPGTVRDVTVAAGTTGVPAGATAVTLNVTVTGTTAASFLTVWPNGTAQPTSSNLNWSAGQTIPNAVTVKVGAGGAVQVFNPSGSTHVIIDVVGYYDESGTGDGFTAQAPSRILDSRPPPEQVGPYSTPWGPGTDREVAVAGVAGIPADADAVVLNATVTGTTAESFLSIYPSGAARPTASNLNWKPGTTIPNAVTVKLGTAGKIRAFNNSGTTNVILDVVGYFSAGSGDPFHPINPVRFQDSRPPPEKVGAYQTPWNGLTTRTVSITTAGAVPASARAVLANVTATTTPTFGLESFLTIWNTGASRPTASSLNWKPGVTIANAVTTRVGLDSTISVYNAAGLVDVIADAAGWYG